MAEKKYMDHWQKVKLLKLYELLRQETDADHPMKTKDICDSLEQMNIKCDRTTLPSDIELLKELGYKIIETRVGHSNGYYTPDASFSSEELKTLIDACEAAVFLTRDHTDELTEKLAHVNSSYQADDLIRHKIVFNARKCTNDEINNTVKVLNEAICSGKRASFRYFRLDENHKPVYRHNGEFYFVEPIAMIYNEDHYYLLCYDSDNIDKKATYRLDRITDAKIAKTSLSAKAKEAADSTDMAEYTEQVFRMFGGEKERVSIQFKPEILGNIFDKFGTDCTFSRMNGNLILTTEVELSPTFYGWYLQFAITNQMKIISPKSVIDDLEEKLNNMGF